jgi:hypothetical protein
MTSAVRVRVVVSELETRDQQHPVGRERTSALALDRREVSADVRGIDARAGVPKRPRIIDDNVPTIVPNTECPSRISRQRETQHLAVASIEVTDLTLEFRC